MSADDRSEHVELRPTPAAARTARSFLKDHVVGLDAPSMETALLCTSELVTNGVLHARTPLVLGVTLGAERLLVTVADRASGRPTQPPRDDDRPSGRGVLLVDALAAQWGVHQDDDGKTVWFTVPKAAS